MTKINLKKQSTNGQAKDKQEELQVEVEKKERRVMNFDENEQETPESEYEKNQPYAQDQTSASGHMPDPETDDDVDEMTKKAGLYEDADEDEPKEVNIAKQVKQDELERRGK